MDLGQGAVAWARPNSSQNSTSEVDEFERFDDRADLAANEAIHRKIRQQSHDIEHQGSVVMCLFHHDNILQLQPLRTTKRFIARLGCNVARISRREPALRLPRSGRSMAA